MLVLIKQYKATKSILCLCSTYFAYICFHFGAIYRVLIEGNSND